ncbi:MAG: hypothetical protein KDA91_15700, partial [Planctomycetaceae bacterium]|nr:hypothetical protein [Planctomycetaceae bacterium]
DKSVQANLMQFATVTKAGTSKPLMIALHLPRKTKPFESKATFTPNNQQGLPKYQNALLEINES